MCFGIFKKKLEDPTMTAEEVIDRMEEAQYSHEYWAVKVVQEPSYAKLMGDEEFHLGWVETYKNVVYYLKKL